MKIKIYVTESSIFLLTLKFYFIGYYDCKGFNYRHLKSPTSSFIGTCSKLRYIYIYIYILIGWQAYRGDQTHRKNSPT